MYTRRDLAKLAVFSPLAASVLSRSAFSKEMINSKFDGVMIGAQTYSFRDRSLDECIAAMKEIGLGYAELFDGHFVPRGREAAQEFRNNPPLDKMKDIRTKFDDAGIVLYALNYSFRDPWTDQQIENGFKIAKAMGINKITASSNVDISPRVDKYAKEYKTYVGFHGHDSMKPNEFSSPSDFAAAMKGRSKYIGINLDIGHFTAAGFDPVAYLEKEHAHIVTLHFKDRKKNHGDNMPFGEGDTNIKGVLQVLKKKHYPIPAMIEYEYGKPGMDTVAEVRKSFEYMKAALA